MGARQHNADPALSWAHRITQLAFMLAIIVLPWRLQLISWPGTFHGSATLYQPFTDYILTYHDLFLAATLLGVLFTRWRRGMALTFRPQLAWLAPIGLSFIALLTVSFGADPALSLFHACRQLFYIFLCLLLTDWTQRPRFIFVAVWIQVAVQALVGMGQVILQRSIGLEWLAEHTLDNAGLGQVTRGIDEQLLLRAYGLTDHPNILAAGLAFGILLLIGVQLPNRPLLLLRNLTLGVATVTFLLTFSQPALTVLILGLLLIGLLLSVFRRQTELGQYGVALLWMACFAIITMFTYRDFFNIGRTEEEAVRIAGGRLAAREQRDALNVAYTLLSLEHPVVGVGIGASPIALAAQEPDFPYFYQPAFNTVKVVAAETGVAGTFFYRLTLLVPWVLLLLNRKRIRMGIPLASCSGGLLAVTLFGMFDAYTWFYATGRFWHWLILLTWIVAFQAAQRPSNEAA